MDSPRTHEAALQDGSAKSNPIRSLTHDSTTRVVTSCKPSYRTVKRRDAARRRLVFESLASSPARGDADKRSAAVPRGDAPALAASLLLSRGATPREAWIQWLQPVFANTDSCYFTGTYSDEYGTLNGMMAQRNVHKDFRRFLDSFQFDGRYIVAVEKHAFRDILHLHAILEGPMSPEQVAWVKGLWEVERGFARALPVQDGCASYVTKYALKGDCDAFEWRLS